MPLIRIVDEGRNYVAAHLGERVTPLDGRPQTSLLATASRCLQGWRVTPHAGGTSVVMAARKAEALEALRQTAAAQVDGAARFRVERTPEVDPGDTDGRLLAALRKEGGRTSTCPCGYTYMDSCPNHD